MTEIIVKTIVDLFLILGIVTKEVRQGRTSMSFLVFQVIYPPKLTFMQKIFPRNWKEGRKSRSRFSG
jgi:hypothetical protein